MGPSVKGGVALSLGLVLLVTGCVLGWYGFPTIIDNMIQEQMVLTNDSVSFEPWQAPTSKIDVFMQFILFNVTNPDEVKNNISKPRVEEVGPFSFKESRQRVNLSWSEDGRELTYYERITYEFDSATSGAGLTEDTPIVTINAIMVVIAAMGDTDAVPANIKPLLPLLINLNERGEIFKEYKAGELLISGAQDKLLSAIMTLAADLVPPIYADGLFKLYPYNNTLDGPYTVLTGEGDIDHFTYIQSYNGNSSLSYWSTPYCNMINGTDGITYPPNTGDVSRIYIFNKDLCRSIYLDYEKDVEYFGIHGRRFTPIKAVLGDPEEYPDNKCFCVPQTPGGNATCYKAGVMSLSPCQFDAPIIASTPHFYMGDQEYVDAVQGLSPDKNRHETFIDIEPMTGLALNGGKKIQINLQLKRYDKINGMELLPEILFPITYTNETALIDQAGADEFNDQLGRPLKLLTAGQWILIAVGALCIIAGAVTLVRAKRNKVTNA